MSTYPPMQTPPAMQPMQKDSTLAIISLIAGIAAYVFLPGIGAITAIITGHIAQNEIKQSNGLIKGQGMATAGLILGYVQIALTLIAVVVIVVLTIMGPQIGSVFSNVNSQMGS